MLGKPKYNIGDSVKFSIEVPVYDANNKFEKFEKETFQGNIYIIDKYGTFEDDSDVSYDIMVTDKKFVSTVNTKGECLYKHINEKLVSKN